MPPENTRRSACSITSFGALFGTYPIAPRSSARTTSSGRSDAESTTTGVAGCLEEREAVGAWKAEIEEHEVEIGVLARELAARLGGLGVEDLDRRFKLLQDVTQR